jgi:hypothetical protein
MQVIDAVEQAVDAAMARLPHLKKSSRQALAKNLWWIAALLAGALALFAAYSVVIGIGYHLWRPTLGGLPLIFVNAVLYFGLALVLAASLRGLRSRRASGWRGLFVWLLLMIFTTVANLIASFSTSNLIWALVKILFFAYAIYEPKEFFQEAAANLKKSPADSAKTEPVQAKIVQAKSRSKSKSSR